MAAQHSIMRTPQGAAKQPLLSRRASAQLRPIVCLARPHSQQLQRSRSSTISTTYSRRDGEWNRDHQPSAAVGLPGMLQRKWDTIPAKSKLAFASHVAFIISNMDKVVFMVSAVPLGVEYGWSPATAGLVQSSFFAGFLLMQIPGGGLSSAFGGRKVLPFGVSVWSAATAVIPLAAVSIPTLCLARAAVGMGQAVGPSSVMDIVARTVPKAERSSAVAFVFAGLHVGSAIALLMAPVLINAIGWRAMFAVFGGFGLVWAVLYEALLADIAKSEPELAASLSSTFQQQSITSGGAASSSSSSSSGSRTGTVLVRKAAYGATATAQRPRNGVQASASAVTVAAPAAPGIPYRAFLRSSAVQALMVTHYCNNWLHYTMLAWLPTYFVDTMATDLLHASQTALLPPLAGIAASAVAGNLADKLLSSGVPLATVRKLAQGFAFLVPAGCLAVACTSSDNNVTIAAITSALGISSFSLAGLYCSHQDLSPKYASALLGLTNTTGSLPGVIGVATVGIIYQNTQSWELALFAPCAAFLLLGTAVYTAGSQHEPVDFDAADNTPFGWELQARAFVNKALALVGQGPLARK